MSITLKQAVFTLLYDLSDNPDMDIDNDDNSFVEYIIDYLIDNNGETCPFKNYDSEFLCSNKGECGKDRFNIDCNFKNGKTKIWREFISNGNGKEKMVESEVK